jgi:DNA-nicking Smr family endonuclease
MSEDPDFRDAVSGAIPLPHHGRAIHKRRPPHPLPVQRMRDEAQALADTLSDHLPWEPDIETGEELVFARDGIGPQVLRKLRRGHWVIQAHLDLHGMRSDEARVALAAFLNDCLRRDARCVRIVHGKGLGSKNREPILKRKLRAWLMQRDEVLAFCQARPVDGGGGAVLALLRGTA